MHQPQGEPGRSGLLKILDSPEYLAGILIKRYYSSELNEGYAKLLALTYSFQTCFLEIGAHEE